VANKSARILNERFRLPTRLSDDFNGRGQTISSAGIALTYLAIEMPPSSPAASLSIELIGMPAARDRTRHFPDPKAY
jgi:hypothetical protein